jgi:hypothetical protein
MLTELVPRRVARAGGIASAACLTGRCPAPRFEPRDVNAFSPPREDPVAGVGDAQLAPPHELGRRPANQYSPPDARQVGVCPLVFAPGHVATAELRRSTVAQPAVAEDLGTLDGTAPQPDRAAPLERKRAVVVGERLRLQRPALRSKEINVIEVDEARALQKRIDLLRKPAVAMVEVVRRTRPDRGAATEFYPVPADCQRGAPIPGLLNQIALELVEPGRCATSPGRQIRQQYPRRRTTAPHCGTAANRYEAAPPPGRQPEASAAHRVGHHHADYVPHTVPPIRGPGIPDTVTLYVQKVMYARHLAERDSARCSRARCGRSASQRHKHHGQSRTSPPRRTTEAPRLDAGVLLRPHQAEYLPLGGGSPVTKRSDSDRQVGQRIESSDRKLAAVWLPSAKPGAVGSGCRG